MDAQPLSTAALNIPQKTGVRVPFEVLLLIADESGTPTLKSLSCTCKYLSTSLRGKVFEKISITLSQTNLRDAAATITDSSISSHIRHLSIVQPVEGVDDDSIHKLEDEESKRPLWKQQHSLLSILTIKIIQHFAKNLLGLAFISKKTDKSNPQIDFDIFYDILSSIHFTSLRTVTIEDTHLEMDFDPDRAMMVTPPKYNVAGVYQRNITQLEGFEVISSHTERNTYDDRNYPYDNFMWLFTPKDTNLHKLELVNLNVGYYTQMPICILRNLTSLTALKLQGGDIWYSLSKFLLSNPTLKEVDLQMSCLNIVGHTSELDSWEAVFDACHSLPLKVLRLKCLHYWASRQDRRQLAISGTAADYEALVKLYECYVKPKGISCSPIVYKFMFDIKSSTQTDIF